MMILFSQCFPEIASFAMNGLPSHETSTKPYSDVCKQVASAIENGRNSDCQCEIQNMLALDSLAETFIEPGLDPKVTLLT